MLLDLETYLDKTIPHRKSLNKTQSKAINLPVLKTEIIKWELSKLELNFYENVVIEICNSIQDNFPQNIFYDLDYLFYQILQESKTSEIGFEPKLNEFQNSLNSIFTIFGIHSSVKFRYIHDFIYGYDWLKWTLEKKGSQEIESPLGEPFLNYITNRGKELENLIEGNDKNYPVLNEPFRNPFLFVRSTQEEEILHSNLSIDHLIPLEAWNLFAIPKSDKNYSEIRTKRALELGIDRNTMPGSHKI